MKPSSVLLLLVLAAGFVSNVRAAEPPADQLATAEQGMFVLRSTAKTPDEVVAAIRAYAENKKWAYLGANKVKQGEVTLVKVCIPEVGKQIWPLGLHLSAMLPCGNLGVYQKEGKTEISLLHPRYMQLIHPDPAIEKASAMAAPMLIEMLDAVAK